MTGVLIRHCVLRVVRHGGRSWGADRRGLLERATRLLPHLIAARLDELLGDAEGEIAEPVRVRIRMERGRSFSGAELRQAIAAALTPELFEALLKPREPLALQDHRSSEQGAAADSPVTVEKVAPAAAAGPMLRVLLLRWREQGDLRQRLRGFSKAALRAWLAALIETSAPAAGTAGTEAEALAREASALRGRLIEAGGLAGDPDRLRLMLMVELAARHVRLPEPETLWRLLDAEVPPASAPPPTGRSPAAPSTADAARHAAETQRSKRVTHDQNLPALPRPAAPRPGQDIALSSVLPFLVLGMLRRIGWLDAATAAFEALALTDRGAVFAAALAFKLLPPPRHGWHRDESALRTAAAFAGLDAAPSPAAFAGFHRDAGGGLSALDSFIASELAAGHTAGQPLLIAPLEVRGARGWLLLDADGLFPVAIADDEASLLASLGMFGPSPVLVSAAAATPDLMRGLAGAGRAFVTDARPGRGESWRRLPGMTGRWASAPGGSDDHLRAAAARQPGLEAAAASVTRALIAERPVGPPGASPGLERAAALSAATGLGMLAWTLWRTREPVDPLLALDRLGDLDGTARFTATTLDIRPAVGRRYLDLKEHRLLADIPGVPWLGGRTVTFLGP